jgi:hypothetical protein
MDWPTQVTYAQLERIADETKRLGVPFNPFACYENQVAAEAIGEWNKFFGNTKTSIVTLFWWTFPAGETDASAVESKFREFKEAIVGDQIKQGRLAFERALDAFSTAAGLNAAFGKMAEKVRLAAEMAMTTNAESWDRLTPEALCQVAGGDAKSGDSPAGAESTQEPTPTGS